VEPVPGTPFAVAYLGVPPIVSGTAIGSLVAGIGSILVSILVGCFGLAGAQGDWGPLVAGAFAVLAGLLGAGAVGLGVIALRQIRAAPGRVSGRGMAVAGIACGGLGALLTLVAMALAFVVRSG
jgi:hypothetical protein